MSRNSATIRHPPTSSHTSHIGFPHHTSPALPTWWRAARTSPPRSDAGARQAEERSHGTKHLPRQRRFAQTLGYLLFFLGLSHANTQRQTEIKSTPPTPFSTATTQSYLPNAGGSAVCAGGVHAAPQETAQRASAESWSIRRNQASRAFQT